MTQNKRDFSGTRGWIRGCGDFLGARQEGSSRALTQAGRVAAEPSRATVPEPCWKRLRICGLGSDGDHTGLTRLRGQRVAEKRLVVRSSGAGLGPVAERSSLVTPPGVADLHPEQGTIRGEPGCPRKSLNGHLMATWAPDASCPPVETMTARPGIDALSRPRGAAGWLSELVISPEMWAGTGMYVGQLRVGDRVAPCRHDRQHARPDGQGRSPRRRRSGRPRAS